MRPMTKPLILAKILRLTALAFVFSVVNACDTFYWDAANKKELVGQRSQLTVAVLSGPWTQQKIGQGHWGLEVDLLKNFADEFGLKFRTLPVNSMRELELSLSSGRADIGAGRITGSAKTSLMRGPGYQETGLSMICRADFNSSPKFIAISGVNDSLELRRELSHRYPSSRIKKLDRTSLSLNLVLASSATCAVIENLEASTYLRFYPSLKVKQTILDNIPVHFMLSKSSQRIQKMLFLWNQKSSQNGQLLRIREKYILPHQALNARDAAHFFSSMKESLQLYRALFKDAGNEYEIPWQLLAAVSFQESHWQDEARSFTGVRGLMMMTEDTAEHMGISDRTDPEQSIWGGAKYLRYLLNLQPRFLPLRERWLLTLASYNVGQGHLRDAQKLAVSLGKNPYSWVDLREVLPLLADSGYASSLEFGLARGREPVEFAERVLGFLDLMTVQIEPSHHL
jgi:membrane-bound lytic murein transglycosylase F